MQAVISKISSTSLEHYVYIGESTRFQVDFLGIVKLRLNTGNFLELQDVAYISSIRRNLISVPIWDRLGYIFPFKSKKVKLYQDSILIGNGILCGSLNRLELSSLPFFFCYC